MENAENFKAHDNQQNRLQLQGCPESKNSQREVFDGSIIASSFSPVLQLVEIVSF
jgi:hypothetical protein